MLCAAEVHGAWVCCLCWLHQCLTMLPGAGGSRASTPTSPLEAGAVFDELPTYLIDVLEEMGNDAARRCFWDMGPWSDLLRVWRPLGVPTSRVTFKVGHLYR